MQIFQLIFRLASTQSLIGKKTRSAAEWPLRYTAVPVHDHWVLSIYSNKPSEFVHFGNLSLTFTVYLHWVSPTFTVIKSHYQLSPTADFLHASSIQTLNFSGPMWPLPWSFPLQNCDSRENIYVKCVVCKTFPFWTYRPEQHGEAGE